MFVLPVGGLDAVTHGGPPLGTDYIQEWQEGRTRRFGAEGAEIILWHPEIVGGARPGEEELGIVTKSGSTFFATLGFAFVGPDQWVRPYADLTWTAISA